MSRRVLWTTVIAAVVMVAIIVGWQYMVFVVGAEQSLALGGRWELVFRTTVSDGGGAAKLYRHRGRTRIAVDELVYTNHYYGDDCLVYTTARGSADRSYYAACGDREPVLLGQRAYASSDGVLHLTEWRIDRDGIAKIVSTPDTRQETKLPIADIKRRALQQPVLREGWYVAPSVPR